MTDLIIYNTDDGESNVALLVADGEVWLTQNQLAELFDTSVQNISDHIKKIINDKELDENSVIKFYLITAKDNKQQQADAEDLRILEDAEQQMKKRKN